MHVKFCLYNFSGRPTAYYMAEAVQLPAPVPSAEVGHHIILADESGSMWGDPIQQSRALIEKLVTVAEFSGVKQHISLLGFSSQGMLYVYAEHVDIEEFMQPGSRYVEAIRSMRARSMTCGSQAMEHAERLIRADETTAISLFTDGYMNDRSPAEETRRIDAWINRMRSQKNVFVNTIGFGYADFSVLSKIANALSGKCIQTRSVKELYDALYDTSKLLAGRTVPAATVAAEGADYQTLVSVSQRKVNGTATDLTIRGMGANDDATVWRFRKVSVEKWQASTAPIVGNGAPLQPLYAFALAKLAEGNLTAAKYALVSTRNETLLTQHAKALTVEQRAALAADLELRLYETVCPRDTFSPDYGLAGSRVSISELCKILAEHKTDWCLDLPEFLKGYQKRGIKRIPGTWETVLDEAGAPTDLKVWTAPATRLVPIDDAEIVAVSAFEQNNANATINMQVSRPAALRMWNSGATIGMAEGQRLSLYENRNYTLVGDGAVNAKGLPIRIAKRALWKTLYDQGALPAHASTYDPTTLYVIDLENLPVLPYEQQIDVPSGAFDQLALLRVCAGILRAALPGGAAAVELTSEQVVGLKKLCLTPALNYSSSSTVPYTDQETAISAGLLDARTGFKVSLLGEEIPGLDDLYSANEYLARRFTVEGVESPTFADVMAGKPVSVKEAKRIKLNAVDALTYPLMRAVLGIGKFDGIYTVEMADAAEKFWERHGIKGPLAKQSPETLAAVLRGVEAEQEAIWAHDVRPLAFWVGSTGTLPEGWGEYPALDGEALEARVPTLKLAKKQKAEGTFFVIDREAGKRITVISVTPEKVWFSTPLGVAAAKAITTDDAE